MKNKPSFTIIGAGKVGSALGILLKERGYTPAGVFSRTPLNAQKLAEKLQTKRYSQASEAAKVADIVFITTTDREIASTASMIALKGGCGPGQILIHTSGALASDVMQPAREHGAWAISVHPLQSFADVESAKTNLPGSCFALEGDEEAMGTARQLVDDLQGQYFTIKTEDKPLYHAAAVVASNYLVSLIHLSTSIYQSLGLSEKQSLDALFPLIQGTINNIAKSGPTTALTGPVVRGDGATVIKHMKALKDLDWRNQEAYRHLGLYTVGVAIESGRLSPKEGTALNNIFMEVEQHEQKGNHCRLPAYETGGQIHSHVNGLRLFNGYTG
ncbi:NADP oxidoreductase, coenzyme F420-dependent [Desulforamulus reducens MI-1]|uniref:NADP oxidoreductase, coenzyme F420-dependent n=1 Tax=Desulforamulus reducens (strain ATCC BAA-1160 / DSM 100696 / MI-1) TaxID=349161 RepID=A4J5F9_DESRM|nr:DUF2520 domain-containing protein [Desulforamulus reducens]ABO50312.1 NADP oxidoreductase, coenzyme F420-dependent [Desulforamulus reducens MI-1]